MLIIILDDAVTPTKWRGPAVSVQACFSQSRLQLLVSETSFLFTFQVAAAVLASWTSFLFPVQAAAAVLASWTSFLFPVQVAAAGIWNMHGAGLFCDHHLNRLVITFCSLFTLKQAVFNDNRWCMIYALAWMLKTLQEGHFQQYTVPIVILVSTVLCWFYCSSFIWSQTASSRISSGLSS